MRGERGRKALGALAGWYTALRFKWRPPPTAEEYEPGTPKRWSRRGMRRSPHERQRRKSRRKMVQASRRKNRSA